MKVAWVTHRDMGNPGGAEMADAAMIARRPDDVEIMLVAPGGVAEDLRDFDAVVVSGLLGLSSREQNLLADLKPVIWVHDMATTGHWLYEKADPLICLTPAHAEKEIEKSPVLARRNIELNPGWMDTSVFYGHETKIDAALWAHATYDHKGLDLAVEWAREKGVELKIMTGQPHDQVLWQMERCRYFILLAKIFDPGPRSVIEAALCNCIVVTNENVGLWEEDREDLLRRVDRADKDFWRIVCGSR